MKLKVLTISIIGLIVISISYLYITRNTPLLYRSVDRASVERSGIVIQNPFRERGPEDRAEQVLQELKDGKCEKALTGLEEDASTIAYACEREGQYPLQSWSLADRQDFGSQVVLVYKVYRNDHGDTKALPALAWIDIKKVGEDWRALSYQTYY